MKKCCVFLALVALFSGQLVALLSSRADAAGTGFPMTCMIGTMNGYNVFLGLLVPFTRSSGPASAGLQPGQCAYEDRAVRSSEPAALCTNGAKFPFSVFVFQNGKLNVASDGTPAGNLVVHAIQGPTTLVNVTVDNPTSIFGQLCLNILKYGV